MFSTFICAECAGVHEENFEMSQCYIKEVFSDSWDTFQLRMVQVGGNKRFFEFMREYGKERETIVKKYGSTAAAFYRRMLCTQAKGKPVTELPPARTATELAHRTAGSAVKFMDETDAKYDISGKANEIGERAKAGFMSLFNKVKGDKNTAAETGGGDGTQL